MKNKITSEISKLKLAIIAFAFLAVLPISYAAVTSYVEVNGGTHNLGVDIGSGYPERYFSIEQGQKLSYKLVAVGTSPPFEININSNGAVTTYKPSANPTTGVASISQSLEFIPTTSGKYDITITAKDKTHTKGIVLHVTVTEPPKNNNPILNPISDKTVYAGETLSFLLSASDADESDKNNLYYTLTAPYSLALKNLVNMDTGLFSWTPADSDVGVYDVTFSVSDKRGGVADQKAKITVKKNTPPVISNTDSVVNAYEGQLFSLKINAEDSDGDLIKYAAYGLPEGASIDSNGLITYNPQYNAVIHPDRYEDYNAVVVAFDGKDGTPYSFTLRIHDISQKPFFTSIPLSKTAEEETEIYFQITASDNDAEDISRLSLATSNSKLSPFLSKVSDGVWQFKWTPKSGDSINSPYILDFNLDDGFALASFARVIINVNAKIVPNTPPVASFTISPKEGIKVGDVVSFDASSSKAYSGDNVENDELEYSWDFGDGTTASGIKVEHSFSKAEPFNVKLTVKEKNTKEKYTSSATKTVTVDSTTIILPRNTPPVAVISYTSPAKDITVGDIVTFNGTLSRAYSGDSVENDELEYSWDFGDGATASGIKVEHSFSKANLFSVNLRVTEKNTAEKYWSQSMKAIEVKEKIVVQENKAPHFAEKEKTINLKELEKLVFEVAAVDDDTNQPTDVRHTIATKNEDYLQYSLVDTNIPVSKDQLKWNFFFSDRNKYVASWKTTLKDSGNYFFKFKVYDPLSNKEDFMTLNVNVEDFNILKVNSWIGLSHSQREINDGDTIDVYENNLLNVLADVRDPSGNEILFPEKNDPISVSISSGNTLKPNTGYGRLFQWTPGYDTVSAPLNQKIFSSIVVKATYQGVDFTRTFNVNVKDGNRGPDVSIISPAEGSNIAENFNSQLKAGITKTDREINKNNILLIVKDKDAPQNAQNVLLNEFIGQYCAGDSSNYDCNYNIPVQKSWPKNLRIELWAADTSGFLGVDFVDVHSEYPQIPTPTLEITAPQCYSPVIQGKEQSCSVEVKSNGQKVDGAAVKMFYESGPNVVNGQQFSKPAISGENDPFNGASNFREVMKDIGHFKVYAIASKAGYIDAERKSAEFDVFEEGYLIENLASYGDSGYSLPQTNFYRGTDLYIKFRVKEKLTQNYVTDVIESATLDNKNTGQKLNLINDGMDGQFYKFKVQIPPNHRFKDETQVFTFAINYDTEKGGESILTINILNNKPSITGKIQDLTCRVGESCPSVDLRNHEGDVEDSGSALKWSASAFDSNLFSVNIDSSKLLSITPLKEGQSSMKLTLTDADDDFAETSVHVSILPKIIEAPQKLELTKPLCYPTLPQGGVQSCSVEVKSEGKKVDGALVSFYLENTGAGALVDTCPSGTNDNFNGGCAGRFTMNNLGTFRVYATASYKGAGYEDSAPSYSDYFNVVENGYDIVNLKSYGDNLYSAEQSSFYRGNYLYIKFRVKEKSTQNYVTDVITSATLDGENTGQKLNLINDGMDGQFYKLKVQIPPNHQFIGGTEVFTFAINTANDKAGQSIITINILNNKPSITGKIQDLTCRVGESCPSVDLRNHEGDVEDSGSALKWSASDIDASLFTASIDSNKIFSIYPLKEGSDDNVVLTLTDADGDSASTNIKINILPGVTIIIPNRAPIITSLPVTSAVEDEPYSYDVNAYDPDGDSIIYEFISKPEGMAINQDTGLITWKPFIRQAGDYTVTVRVRETKQSGLSAIQSYTLRVESAPHSLRNDIIGIDSISVPSSLGGYSGGDYIPIEISFTNNGRIRLRNVIASVALIDDYSDEPNYPIRISFDAAAGETVKKRLYVELPSDLEYGKEYYISVTSSNVNARGSVEGPLIFW